MRATTPSPRDPRPIREAADSRHEVKPMRRLLTPSVVLLAGLSLALVGCSGESPTSPSGAGGGSGSGTCAVTISLSATSVTPLAGTGVIIRATVKKNGVAVPDGSSVVFTTDFGIFLETGLPSVSKVTTSGFADVTLGSAASGTSNVKATLDCGTSTIAVQFAAIPTDGPYISSMSPLTGSCLGGDIVTIIGGRFLTSLAVQPKVTFGGAQATVTSASASQIVVLTPSRTLADSSVPETVNVVVTVNPGTGAIQTTTPAKFTYTCIGKRVAITSVNPKVGSQLGNEPVVVTGVNFLPSSSSGPATTRVTFGNVTASVTGQTNTALNVTTPKHLLANPAVPETVDVGVTVDLGLPTQQSASLPQSFTYVATGQGTACGSDPRLFITRVATPANSTSPGSTDGGEVVTISGGGFQPQVNSRIKVEFGGIQAVATADSDSQITAIAPRFTLTNPDQPQAVDIKVTVDVGGSREACITATKAYTYFPGSYTIPFITSMSPSTGPNDASTRVTIFGKNFRFPAQVFVGVAEAAVVSISSSQIVFMTPTATGANAAMAGQPQQVKVLDTYSGSYALNPNNITFRYYSCPTTGTAAPATAPWNVSTPVTISGSGFEEPVEAVFTAKGSTYRVNVVSVSSSAIVVQMPVLDQLLGTGNFDCTDVTGSIALTFPGLACAGTIQVSFTYQMNRPTISSVSPPTVTQAGGQTVTVTGTNFTSPMSVVISASGYSQTVNAVTVGSSSQLTFTAPALPSSAFTTQSCTTSGVTGTQLTTTSFGVAITRSSGGCTAQLSNSLSYTPTDTTCKTTPVITTTSLPAAAVCATYTPTTIAVAGGLSPYSFSATGLPAGLAIDPALGKITGNPSLPVPGPGVLNTTYNVIVTVTDSSTPPLSASRTLPLFLNDPTAPLGIAGPANGTVPATGGTVGPYTASGGAGTIAWTVTSVNPATGLITASASPVNLVVSPTLAAGSYTVTLQAADSLSCGPHAATKTVTVVKQAGTVLDINPVTIPQQTLCTASTVPQFTTAAGASGTGTLTWALSSVPALPNGLVFNTGTGALTGTPQLMASSPYAQTTTYALTVTVTDSAIPAQTATRTFSMVISDPMAPFNILGPTNVVIPAAGGAQAYSINPSATGAFVPVTWQLSGSIPAGITLSPLSGNSTTIVVDASVPATGGVGTPFYEFTLKAVDNSCGTVKHTVDLVVRVTKPSGGLLAFNYTSFPNATVCAAYLNAPTTTGGTGPITYSLVASSLPTGLNLNTSNGAITGAAAILASGPGTVSQSYTVSIRATDSTSPPQTVTNTYTFNVLDPAALFGVTGSTTVAPTSAAGGNFTYNLSGTTVPVPENWPYTWSIVSVTPVGAAQSAPGGAFTLSPNGVSNSTSATLGVAGSGVLVTGDSYDVTIQVRDSGCSSAGNYHVNTITVRVNVS